MDPEASRSPTDPQSDQNSFLRTPKLSEQLQMIPLRSEQLPTNPEVIRTADYESKIDQNSWGI